MGQQLQAEGIECPPRTFVIGGEALSLATARLWQSLSPKSRLINEYGPTETVVGCSIYEVGTEGYERPDVPIGRPIANTRMVILDGQMQPVPVGVVGELYIGGAGVARGYLNRPDLTAERFVRDPFSDDPDARLYKTGDLGRYLADGNIDYLGRNDFQVKIRGFRIELGEIEAKLTALPQVKEAVVLAKASAAGDRRLVAYVVMGEGIVDVDDDSAAVFAERQILFDILRRHLGDSLPDYMVPTAFVLLASLPLSPNGKIDRKALPDPDVAQQHASYVAPRTEVEQLLCALWEEVLGLERVGVTDNFLEIGGHSLLATQLAVRIRQEFGLTLPLSELFKAQTVESLANAMHAHQIVSGLRIDENEVLLSNEVEITL
jgi:acyl-coenzyme A synthetase/AMP-(fatty) acid ligase/acyl carrier protein